MEKSTTETFTVTFKESYFNSEEFLYATEGQCLKVLDKPFRKWYQVLLQWITFGWYKANYYYKVEILNYDAKRIKSGNRKMY